MTKLVLALALMASVSEVQAQQRPFSPGLPCRQVQQIVAANGAAVISTGQFTYDRYVRDPSFCAINESVEPTWVPSLDTPQCPIGYRCRTGRFNTSRD